MSFWRTLFGLKEKPIPPVKNEPMFIIDISKWNGNITFPKLKTNSPPVEGVIIRASNGHTQDPMFNKNAQACIDNEIPFGAYHFAQFYTNDVIKSATDQANRFASIVEHIGKPTLPLVLDTETNEKNLPITAEQLEVFCQTFLNVLEQKGYDVAIYMSPGFSWFFPKNHKLGKYKFWAADYTGAINAVNGWKNIWLHQFTDKGVVRGIGTAVDLNRTVQ